MFITFFHYRYNESIRNTEHSKNKIHLRANHTRSKTIVSKMGIKDLDALAKTIKRKFMLSFFFCLQISNSLSLSKWAIWLFSGIRRKEKLIYSALIHHHDEFLCNACKFEQVLHTLIHEYSHQYIMKFVTCVIQYSYTLYYEDYSTICLYCHP